jgi:hypothetical protein
VYFAPRNFEIFEGQCGILPLIFCWAAWKLEPNEGRNSSFP